MAANACDPTGATPCTTFDQPTCAAAALDPKVRYPYYDPKAATTATNLAPTPSAGNTQFVWSAKQPYTAQYRMSGGGTSPQAVRCWQVYHLTQSLNGAWRTKLGAVPSVFANYMLIDTQWGAHVEPLPGFEMPANAFPGLLSNLTLETYIQNYTKVVNNQGPGSCIGCHAFATLADNHAVGFQLPAVPGQPVADPQLSSELSPEVNDAGGPRPRDVTSREVGATARLRGNGGPRPRDDHRGSRRAPPRWPPPANGVGGAAARREPQHGLPDAIVREVEPSTSRGKCSNGPTDTLP
jgi:hypothetical protein